MNLDSILCNQSDTPQHFSQVHSYRDFIDEQTSVVAKDSFNELEVNLLFEDSERLTREKKRAILETTDDASSKRLRHILDPRDSIDLEFSYMKKCQTFAKRIAKIQTHEEQKNALIKSENPYANFLLGDMILGQAVINDEDEKLAYNSLMQFIDDSKKTFGSITTYSELSKDFGQAHTNLGLLFLNGHDRFVSYEQARFHLEEAISLANFIGVLAYGDLLEGSKQYDSALTHWKEIHKQFPSKAQKSQILTRLGILEIEMNDKKSGMENLKRAEKLGFSQASEWISYYESAVKEEPIEVTVANILADLDH